MELYFEPYTIVILYNKTMITRINLGSLGALSSLGSISDQVTDPSDDILGWACALNHNADEKSLDFISKLPYFHFLIIHTLPV